jgi:hypothetical protein
MYIKNGPRRIERSEHKIAVTGSEAHMPTLDRILCTSAGVSKFQGVILSLRYIRVIMFIVFPSSSNTSLCFLS